MSRLVMGLGVVFILLGLVIMIFPDQLVSAMDWESRRGLYVAAGMRVVTGLVLVLSASSTRYPTGLRIFGGLVLLAGLGLLLIPTDSWVALIRWWLFENRGLYRMGGGVVAMLFGAFLVHASLPEGPAA